MELFFEVEPTEGNSFTMEVSDSDTIGQIKSKIQELKIIPVAKQTLIFNNQPLLDDDLVIGSFSEITNESKIHLIITNTDHYRRKLKLLMKLPLSQRWVSLQIDSEEPVISLKQIIRKLEPETKGIPIILKNVNGRELKDLKPLYRCRHLSDNSEIVISLPPPRAAVSSSSAVQRPRALWAALLGFQEEIRVILRLDGGRGNVPVMVHATDNVVELRKLNVFGNADGAFKFFHMEEVMDEHRSFEWHMVEEGNNIIQVLAVLENEITRADD